MINPSPKDVENKFGEYSTRLREAKKKDPPESVLLFVLVAGHGLQIDGN